MARQLRNKRKKSPSVAVTVEDTGTVQGTPLQSLPNAADDVLGGDSDYEIVGLEQDSAQARGRPANGVIDNKHSGYDRIDNKTDIEVNHEPNLDVQRKVTDNNVLVVKDAALEGNLASGVEVQDGSVLAPDLQHVERVDQPGQPDEAIHGTSATLQTPQELNAHSARDISRDEPSVGRAETNEERGPPSEEAVLWVDELRRGVALEMSRLESYEGRDEMAEERGPPSEDVVRSVDEIRSNLHVGMQELETLQEVYTCSNSGGNTVATLLPSVDLRYEVNDATALRRIYTLATLRGNVRLHNLGLARPQDYSFVEKEKYIRRKAPPGVAEFFLLGTVTMSKLLGGEVDKNRQLCLRPMWELFGRSQAFVGAMLKKKGYYLSTFHNGVSFSSLFPQKPRENGRTYPTRSRYSNTVLPFIPAGVDVPIYNGTVNPFTLSTYHNLERYSEELQENSVVMVTFTIGAYPLSADKVPLDAMPGLDTRVSFNIKDVVLIAPSSVDFREKNPSGEEPWGVERIEDLWQGETEDNGETNPILEQEI